MQGIENREQAKRGRGEVFNLAMGWSSGYAVMYYAR